MKKIFPSHHFRILAAIIIVGVLFGFGVTQQQKNGTQEARPIEPLSPSETYIDTAIRTDMDECLIQDMKESCYLDAANTWYAQFELGQIFSALERTEQERAVFVRCHQTTHYLGRNNFKTAQNIGDAYGRCTPVCHGGCYHGVIEGYFQENGLYSLGPEHELLPQVIPTICGKKEDYSSSRLFRECHHGIGHGLMFLTNMNLPVALGLCDLLEDKEDREACYSGVFMENSSSSTSSDHFSSYINPDDPLYPCNTLEERYLSKCYAYQSSFFSILTDQDWTKTIDLCFQVPQDYQGGCFEILGSNQVGSFQNFAVMKDNCSLVPDATMRNFCIGGIISGLGGRYIEQPTYMSEFCSTVEPDNKKICYRKMGEALSSWGYDFGERKNVCENVEDKKFVAVCRGTS